MNCSGAVGDRALVAGDAAAIVLDKLLPPNPRSELIRHGITGEQLDAAMTAVAVLREAADSWLQQAISARGNGEGLSAPQAPASTVWISTAEAAQILGVTDRRVRQFGEEGPLTPRSVGGYLQFSVTEVLALRRERLD